MYLLAIFEVNNIFEAVINIGSSLKSEHQVKFSLSKSQSKKRLQVGILSSNQKRKFGFAATPYLILNDQGSISSTFYVHVFLYKSAPHSFFLVRVWLWQKDFGKKRALSYEKRARKILMKLITDRRINLKSTKKHFVCFCFSFRTADLQSIVISFTPSTFPKYWYSASQFFCKLQQHFLGPR